MGSERMFPVMRPWKDRGRIGMLLEIPWEMVAPHEQQAQRNHGQTLERLAERGGLDPSELLAVLDDRRWEMLPVGIASSLLDARVSEYIQKVEKEKKP